MGSSTKETERKLHTLGGDDPAQPQARAHIVVYLGERSTFVNLEEGKSIVLGRADDSDVHLDTPTVSRRHLEVRLCGRELFARDLGSTNGTFVNGVQLQGEVVLRGGDEVALGDVLVVVGLTSPLSARTRILSGTSFTDWLSHELLRASRLGRTLVLVRVRVANAEGDAAEALRVLLESLPGRAVAGPAEGGEYHVLVDDATPASVRDACLALSASPRLLSSGVSFGIACFPRDGQDLASLVQRAQEAMAESAHLRPQAEGAGPIAEDPAMVRVFALVDRLARVDGTFLLVGETGVGKDVVAREIHRRSARARGPFVHVNCGAIPSGIFEREMFGHERGAFTGASERRIGLFEAASGGTLFLDEIGEIPLGDQPSLLRAIERRSVARVGSVEEIPVDIRIIAATNRDLDDLVRRARFREDLYYRLNGLTIFVPALRDRRLDIAPLARRFFSETTERCGRAELTLSADAIETLERHDWPGNVRELRNVVERAVLLASARVVSALDILALLHEEPLSSADLSRDATLKTLVEEVERAAVRKALEECGENQGLAADKLGISRRALIYKMQRYGIPGRGRGVH